MNSKSLACSFATLAALCAATSMRAADANLAATATNESGVDLYRRLATGDGNLCLSPYSIENALAMTFAGADGKTHEEMARVLHFSTNDDALHGSFGALQHQLEEMAAKSAKQIAEKRPIRFLVGRFSFSLERAGPRLTFLPPAGRSSLSEPHRPSESATPRIARASARPCSKTAAESKSQCARASADPGPGGAATL